MSEYTNIHRFLDDAFAGVPRTPDNQDFKEELRGNLSARAAELEAGGLAPESAAQRAISELGDVRDLLDDTDQTPGPSTPGVTAARLVELNRVRVDSRFVVRIVGFSLLLAIGIAVVAVWAIAGYRQALDLTGDIPPLIFTALGALSTWAIVSFSLFRETAQHFAMPGRRALRYGFAAASAFEGLAFVAVFLGDTSRVSNLTIGGLGLIVSLVFFVELGVTQTNRSKPWVRELHRTYEIADRFAQDPAAAARFGIYTVVIWILAIAGFVGISIVAGFAWSWLALVAGFVVFFLVLARMLFPAEGRERR